MTTLPQYRELAEFRYQIRRFIAFSERAARAADLEPRQHQLLLAIKGLPAGRRPTIGALAERMQLRHHSVVELVDRLAARRLVARRRSERDAREILLVITAAGERLLHKLTLGHQAELQAAGPSLVKALGDLLTATRSPR
jgi:DNA-binding MarR family transcriptional regulator